MSSNIPQDTSDIVVPPFPSSEEEEKVVEIHATESSIKKRGKGVIQSEVFALQKSINGPPNPQSFRNFVKSWRRLIKC